MAMVKPLAELELAVWLFDKRLCRWEPQQYVRHASMVG